MRDLAARLAAGRLTRRSGVALWDLRGAGDIDPRALYAEHDDPVGVFLFEHPRGGRRYAVGLNPHVPAPVADLDAALRALAAAEHAHGAPARVPVPGPNSENWGGRATVFGSPWNYGSRLTPDEVVAIVKHTLRLSP